MSDTCHECGRDEWCYSCATKGGPGAHLVPYDQSAEPTTEEATASPHNTSNKETLIDV